jgi:hypothetical protein
LEAAHGETESPDATIHGDSEAITGVVFRGKPLAKVVEGGEIAIGGSRKAVGALFRALT